jgi:hypothetical protein
LSCQAPYRSLAAPRAAGAAARGSLVNLLTAPLSAQVQSTTDLSLALSEAGHTLPPSAEMTAILEAVRPFMENSAFVFKSCPPSSLREPALRGAMREALSVRHRLLCDCRQGTQLLTLSGRPRAGRAGRWW